MPLRSCKSMIGAALFLLFTFVFLVLKRCFYTAEARRRTKTARWGRRLTGGDERRWARRRRRRCGDGVGVDGARSDSGNGAAVRAAARGARRSEATGAARSGAGGSGFGRRATARTRRRCRDARRAVPTAALRPRRRRGAWRPCGSGALPRGTGVARGD
jgi:hypothetical protein